MADEEQPRDGAEEKKAGKPILLILIAVVVSLAAGAGGAWFLLGRNAPSPDAQAEQAEAEPAVEPDLTYAERVFSLEPFVVNVTGDGYPRYLKMEVAFEMSSPEAKLEIESRVAQVRDTTILLLSSKRLSDVTDFEGKALLKDDLRDRVNALMDAGRVESVLFTEFVVQ